MPESNGNHTKPVSVWSGEDDMANRFPRFVDDQHVFCFNCESPIAGPFQESGLAPGHGARKGQCANCGMTTYFDLASAARAVTYCSFATPDACLGILILEGQLSAPAAAAEAWRIGCNPGGQLLACPCTETDPDVPPEIFRAMWENRNRLVKVSEARELFEARSIKELKSS